MPTPAAPFGSPAAPKTVTIARYDSRQARLSRLVIQHYAPERIWLVRIAVVLLFLVAVPAAYWVGEIQAGYNRFESHSEITGLRQEARSLEAQRRHLKEALGHVQELNRVDALAREKVRARIVRIEDRLLLLRERLDFYRGIVAPSKLNHVLRIQGLDIIHTRSHHFVYRLVLIATPAHHEPIQGRVELTVVGRADGRHEVLTLRALAPQSQDPLPFGFTSYEDLVGHLILPRGFRPKAVHIAVLVLGHAHPVLSQTFEWPVFLS